MDSWAKIEERFRTLVPVLRHQRLDVQWGAAGEHWSVTGGGSSSTKQQFELLASLAGKLLEQVINGNDELDQALRSTENPKVRWFKAMKAWSPEFSMDFYAKQMNEDGSSAGLIYGGSIPEVAEAAANLCLSLHMSRPLPDTNREKNMPQINNFNGPIHGQLNVAGTSISAPSLQLTLNEILSRIERADVPESEKQAAKSVLSQFLNHPLVSSIVGGVAGGIVG